MKLIAIGFVGNFQVYVNLSKEEAIQRHDLENPDYTVEGQGLNVMEIIVKDNKFAVYDIWDEQ